MTASLCDIDHSLLCAKLWTDEWYRCRMVTSDCDWARSESYFSIVIGPSMRAQKGANHRWEIRSWSCLSGSAVHHVALILFYSHFLAKSFLSSQIFKSFLSSLESWKLIGLKLSTLVIRFCFLILIGCRPAACSSYCVKKICVIVCSCPFNICVVFEHKHCSVPIVP